MERYLSFVQLDGKSLGLCWLNLNEEGVVTGCSRLTEKELFALNCENKVPSLAPPAKRPNIEIEGVKAWIFDTTKTN